MSDDGRVVPGSGSDGGQGPAESPAVSSQEEQQQAGANASKPVPEPAPEQVVPHATAGPVPSGEKATALAVEGLIREYSAAVKWNSLVRTVFPVFVLALIVVFMVVTVLGVMSSFPERRITQETVKAGEELMPILNNVVRTFVDDVAPLLAEEFQRGLETGADRIGKLLLVELERLEAGMGDHVKASIHVAVAAQLKSHKDLIKEAMPELAADPEKLQRAAETLNRTFEMWTVRYMLAMLEDYFLVMAKINDTVNKHYRSAPPAAGQGVPEGEMLELFMELLNAAYAEEEGAPIPAPPTAAAPPATVAPAATVAPSEAVAPSATVESPAPGAAPPAAGEQPTTVQQGGKSDE